MRPGGDSGAALHVQTLHRTRSQQLQLMRTASGDDGGVHVPLACGVAGGGDGSRPGFPYGNDDEHDGGDGEHGGGDYGTNPTAAESTSLPPHQSTALRTDAGHLDSPSSSSDLQTHRQLNSHLRHDQTQSDSLPHSTSPPTHSPRATQPVSTALSIQLPCRNSIGGSVPISAVPTLTDPVLHQLMPYAATPSAPNLATSLASAPPHRSDSHHLSNQTTINAHIDTPNSRSDAKLLTVAPNTLTHAMMPPLTTASPLDTTAVSDKPICRFCLDDETAGPLASPCNCNGSAKYVHITCLQKWRKLASNPYNRIRCEICHAYYRLKYSMSGFIGIATARACCWIGYLVYSLIMLYVFRWILGVFGMRMDGGDVAWTPNSDAAVAAAAATTATTASSTSTSTPSSSSSSSLAAAAVSAAASAATAGRGGTGGGTAVVGESNSVILRFVSLQSRLVQFLSPIGPCILLVDAYPSPTGDDGPGDLGGGGGGAGMPLHRDDGRGHDADRGDHGIARPHNPRQPHPAPHAGMPFRPLFFHLDRFRPSPTMVARHIEVFIWWAIISYIGSMRIAILCVIADSLYIYCTVIGCILVVVKSIVWADAMAPKLLVLIADVNGNDIAF